MATFWFSSFLPSANTSRKSSQSSSKIPNVWQILNPSGTLIHFPHQQPSWLPTLSLGAIPSNKPYHVPSVEPSDQTCDSPSVSVSVHTCSFSSITPAVFYSCVPSEKPSYNPIINQLQYPTGARMYKNHIESLIEDCDWKKKMQENIGNITSKRNPFKNSATLPIFEQGFPA